MLNHLATAVTILTPFLLFLQWRETFGGKRSHGGRLVRGREVDE